MAGWRRSAGVAPRRRPVLRLRDHRL